MINRQLIIQEASKKAQDIINKHAFSATDAIGMVPMGPVHTLGNMANGFLAGRKNGHAIAGALLGREGSVGAMSKHDKNVSIGDVYTKKNMAARGLKGAILGGAMGAMSGVRGGPHAMLAGALTGAAAGGLIGSTVTPGVGYGLGKVFGSKKPEKEVK